MERFIKTFTGYPSQIEDNVNELVRKRNLNIVSISAFDNMGKMYVVVLFEKQV